MVRLQACLKLIGFFCRRKLYKYESFTRLKVFDRKSSRTMLVFICPVFELKKQKFHLYLFERYNIVLRSSGETKEACFTKFLPL